MNKEFFDTADLCLNHEVKPPTAWGNLGYWRAASTYPQACAALAAVLADKAQLKEQDSVLDLGFGMGQQLLLWQQQYGIKELHGLNPSLSQCQYAQRFLPRQGFHLHCSTAEDWLLKSDRTHRFDKIVAVDSAYHFQRRNEVFAALSDSMHDNSLFVWTDLLLPVKQQKLPAELTLQLFCRACRIPRANLNTLPQTQQQLAQAGLQLLLHEDLTDQVFLPFAQWWKAYAQRQSLQRKQRLKYDITAAALRYAQSNNLLSYGLFVARKRV